MPLTLRQLEIFRAIAIRGTTTAAALSVPLSQSAASAALHELEQTLAVQLFDRVGKRLLLNDNGRVLLPAALALLDGAKTAAAAFSGESAAGDLHLFASTTAGNYLLPSLLARFREQEPQTRLQLRIGNSNDVVAAVRQFDADLGLIEGPCHDPDIQVIPWLQDELVIVAAPAHPLARSARRRPVSAAQLASAFWLIREPGSGTREAVEQAFSSSFPVLPKNMTLGGSEAIKNAVAEGMGVSYLSRYVARDFVLAKRLRILDTQLPKVTRRFSIIHHQKKILSEPLRRFMDHCVLTKQLT